MVKFMTQDIEKNTIFLLKLSDINIVPTESRKENFEPIQLQKKKLTSWVK